jgi:hypothetical protein
MSISRNTALCLPVALLAAACADPDAGDTSAPELTTRVAYATSSDPSSCVPGATGVGVLNTTTYSINGASAASRIAALAGVWCITGNVRIYDTNLTSLAGLQALQVVTGSLSIGTANLNRGNASLRNLTGLPAHSPRCTASSS